ncbi:DUF7948 domain-containing protein [Thermonema rossianum]|uniref:DUF7948 domain-containing protein n=1 Tax=Thermonema rossianum TaxID=55505 RepID=UPI00068F7405|nr:gliding motility-associated C-terminal domain-containing protein [Thermonema rossianum]
MNVILRICLLLLYILSISGVRAQPSQRPAFVRNAGQWAAEVLYRADLPGGFLFVYADSLQFSWYDAERVASLKHGERLAQWTAPQQALQVHSYVIRFKGANKVLPSCDESSRQLPVKYFLPGEEQGAASQVRRIESSACSGLRFANVYDRIDLRLLTTPEGHIKYEFWLHPGAKPADIRLEYAYTQGLRITKEGHLAIKTIFGEALELAPVVYQLKDGQKKPLKARYALKKNTLKFILEDYDPSATVVIDPELVFSTYSGAASDNWGNTATYDEEGVLYSGGTAYGSNFPNPPGIFTIGPGGTSANFPLVTDVVIFKYNPTGTQLEYIALIGGSSSEVPHSLVVDHNRDLVILGTTSSTNFPTTDGSTFHGGVPVSSVLGNSYANGSDIFVIKLGFDGNLKASTLIGGSNNDGIKLYSAGTYIHNYGDEFRGDIYADANNNLYIASTTRSATIAGVTGSLNGAQDGLFLKLDSNLQLIWGHYVGGSGVDMALSVREAPNGDLYVGGGTTSADLPNTANAYLSAAQGSDDGFVARFLPDGTWLQTTYLGTAAADMVFFVDTDAQGQVYAFGQTYGNYPVSAGVYAVPGSGQFVHKLATDLRSSVWSTTVGSGDGAPDISPTAFSVVTENDCGNIYFAGWGGAINRAVNGGINNNASSSTENLPTTFDAYRRTTVNGNDFYIAVLEKDAKSLLYATFFGEDSPNERGDHVDGGTSRFSKSGTIYHAVCASCGGTNGFPVTEGAWSANNNSYNCNNAVFKFTLDLEATFEIQNPALGFSVVNSGDKVCARRLFFDYQAIGAETFVWDIYDALGNKIYTQSGEADFFYEFTEEGVYTVNLTVINFSSCAKVARASQTVEIVFPPFTVSDDVSICYGDTVQLLAAGADTYEWSPAEGLSDPTIANPLAFPLQSTTYYVLMRDKAGCEYRDSVRVEILPFEPVSIEVERVPSCAMTDGVRLRAVGGLDSYTYRWQMGDGSILEGAAPDVYFYTQGGTYDILLLVDTGDCVAKLKQSIQLEEKPVPPNVITPNGDGINDVFVLPEAGARLQVVNRWGKVVYESANYQNDWGGSDLPAGVYFFYTVAPNGKECRGWLHLLR